MDKQRSPEIAYYHLTDDGIFPNNSLYPLIVYKGVFDVSQVTADEIGALFKTNKWEGIWYNGIYSFHHYHSTAHEVLGIAQSQGRVQFGGEEGVILEVSAGDVVIIPAGVAHKQLWSASGFLVVGGYPSGEYPDMMYGNSSERPQADRNIHRVPIPSADPILGLQGPLINSWTNKIE